MDIVELKSYTDHVEGILI